MDSKLVFFDVDGTLITEDTYIIPKSTVSAIHRLRSNGRLAFINTGRPYSHIDDIIKDIGFDGYVCSCGTYIRYGKEVLLYRTVPPEICSDIINLVRKCRLDAIYEALSGIYFDAERPMSEIVLENKSRFENMGFDTNLPIDAPDFHFDKFIVWTNDNSDFSRFYSGVKGIFDCIDRGNGLYEFVLKGYSKATGIQFILDNFKIPLQNCYAIGDSPNDLPMLSYIPNSIAMGNSPGTLTEKVSFVTKSIEENGVEYALEHFKLI